MATATATGQVTYAQLTTEQRVFYEMQMLRRAVPNFLHVFFGMEGSVFPLTSLPENQGHQIQWNKLGALTATTTALTEGITPEPEDITVSTVTGTVREYGSYIRYTKSMASFGIHKIAAEAADALGEQAGDSLDQITRAILVAETSNVQYANGRSATNDIVSGDYLTLTEIMQAVTTLKTNKAVGPLGDGKFPCLLHPKSSYDLYTDSVFQAVITYAKERGDMNPWVSGHLGDAFGVSFYETPNGYSATNTQPIVVHSTILLGKASFGVGGLSGYIPQIMKENQNKSNKTFEQVKPLRMIDKPFGSTGTADPFDRLASIAWYTTFVAVVLDATFYARIEHDVAL